MQRPILYVNDEKIRSMISAPVVITGRSLTGKCARWFPQVVPGAASGIAHVESSAAEPVTPERASFGLGETLAAPRLGDFDARHSRTEARLLRKVNVRLIR